MFSATVPYPRHMTEPLARCSIGWDLDGQTSGALLFSRAADIKVVTSMLNRLAGHMSDLTEEAVGHGGCAPDLDVWIDPAATSSQKRLRTLLGSKFVIFAALLPGRTINGRCLEPHNGLHAILRGDKTHVWITHSPQDVLRSIGGTPALLSLAHHLLSDSPGLPAAKSSPSRFAGHNVDTVLSILLSFLDGNVANQVWNHTFRPHLSCVWQAHMRCRAEMHRSRTFHSIERVHKRQLFIFHIHFRFFLAHVFVMSERFLLRGRRGDLGATSPFLPRKEFCTSGGPHCHGARQDVPDLCTTQCAGRHHPWSAWSSWKR